MKKYFLIIMLCLINQAFANLDFGASLSSSYNLSKSHFKLPKMANEVSYESSSGGFSTSFNIPLYNLNSDLRKVLEFNYSSHEQLNRGFGVGFRLSLPHIQPSRFTLRSDFTLTRNGAVVELKREGDELFELNITFFGKYLISGQQLVVTYPDGFTEIYDLKTGNIVFEISKFNSSKIEYIWDANLLSSIKLYNGIIVDFLYSPCVTESSYYKRSLRESVVDGFFHKNDKCLERVTYNKGKNIHLKYADAFLSKVYWENVEDKAIFRADYTKLYRDDKEDRGYKIFGVPTEDSFILNLGEEGVRFVPKLDFYSRLGMIPGTTSANLEAQGRYGSIQSGDFNGDGITDLIVSSYVKTPGKKDEGTFDGIGHWEGAPPSWQAPRLNVYLGSLNESRTDLDFRISNEFSLPNSFNNLVPVCAKINSLESADKFVEYFPSIENCNMSWKDLGGKYEGSFNTYLKEHSKLILLDINGDRLLDLISCGEQKYIAINKFNSFEVKPHNYSCDSQSLGADLNNDGFTDLVTASGVLINNGGAFQLATYPETETLVKFLEKSLTAAKANTFQILKKLTDEKVLEELNDGLIVDSDLDGVPEVNSKKNGVFVFATYGRDMTPLKFKSGVSTYEIASNDYLNRLNKIISWSGYQNNVSYRRNGYNVVVDQVTIKGGAKSYLEKMTYSRPMVSNLTFENLGYSFVSKERSGVEGRQDSEKYYVFKTNLSTDNPLFRVPFFGVPLYEMECAAGTCPALKRYFFNPPDNKVQLKEAEQIITFSYTDYLFQHLSNIFKPYQYYTLVRDKTKFLKKENGEHLGYRISSTQGNFTLNGPMYFKNTIMEGLKINGSMTDNFPARLIEEIHEMQICDNSITPKRLVKKYYSAANLEDKETVISCRGSYSGGNFQLQSSEVIERQDQTSLDNSTSYDRFGHVIQQVSSTGESLTSNVSNDEMVLAEKTGYGVYTKTTFSWFGDVANVSRKDKNNQLVRDVNIQYLIPGLVSNISSDGKNISLDYQLNSDGFSINEIVSKDGEVLDKNSTWFAASGAKLREINTKDSVVTTTYRADLNELGEVLNLYTPKVGLEESGTIVRKFSYDYLGRVLNDFNLITGKKIYYSYVDGFKVEKEGNNVEKTDLAPSSVPLAILDNENEYGLSSTTDNLLKAIHYYDESVISFKRDGLSSITEVLFNFGSEGEGFAKPLYKAKTTSKNKIELGIFNYQLNEFGQLESLENVGYGGVYKYSYDSNSRYMGTSNTKEQYTTQFKYNKYDSVVTELYKVKDQSLSVKYERNGLEQIESITFNDNQEKVQFNYKGHRVAEIFPYIKLIKYDNQGNFSQIIYNEGPTVFYSYNIAGQLNSIEVQDYKESYVYNIDEKIESMTSNFNKDKEIEIRNYQYLKKRLVNPDTTFQLPQRNSTLNLDLGNGDYGYYVSEDGNEIPVQVDVDQDEIIFEGFGQIRGLTNRNDKLSLFLSSDLHFVDGNWVKYFSINGKVIGVLVLGEKTTSFYPIVTDVRNSLRMIFYKDKPVVIKNYNDWGNLNLTKSKQGNVAEVIKLDFSGLIRNSNNSKYLMSQSRIYSPAHHQWTTFDVLMLRYPEKITFSSIRETDGISYVADDPINYSDPSGKAAMVVTVTVGAAIGGVAGGIQSAATGGDVMRGILAGAIGGAIAGSGAGLVAEAASYATFFGASLLSSFGNIVNQKIATGKISAGQAALAAVVGPVGVAYGQLFRSSTSLLSQVAHETAAGISYMSLELATSFGYDRATRPDPTGSSKGFSSDRYSMGGDFSFNRSSAGSSNGYRGDYSFGYSGGGASDSEYKFSTSFGTGGRY